MFLAVCYNISYMYIACDIGGTLIRVASSSDLESFSEPIIKDNVKEYEEGIKLLIQTIKDVLGNEKATEIVIGMPGVISKDHKTVLRSPHLPGWNEKPIVETLEKEFGAKVYLENDAGIVGLGEAYAGAGKGYGIVAYITVSTGVGGAKITNGKIEHRRLGFEPGFQILDVISGKNFEDLASGTAIQEKFGMHPKDVAKTPSWDLIEKYVAAGIHNVTVMWSPDVIVLGGSMAKDFRLENIKNEIRGFMRIFSELPEIKLFELGKIGGIHGGFAYLKSLKKD